MSVTVQRLWLPLAGGRREIDLGRLCPLGPSHLLPDVAGGSQGMMGSHSWKGLEWPYSPEVFRLCNMMRTVLHMRAQAVNTRTENPCGPRAGLLRAPGARGADRPVLLLLSLSTQAVGTGTEDGGRDCDRCRRARAWGSPCQPGELPLCADTWGSHVQPSCASPNVCPSPAFQPAH